LRPTTQAATFVRLKDSTQIWPGGNLASKDIPLWVFLLLSAISFFAFLNRWRKAHHVAFKNAIISESIQKDVPPSQ
jgi:hypothetical protein